MAQIKIAVDKVYRENFTLKLAIKDAMNKIRKTGGNLDAYIILKEALYGDQKEKGEERPES